MWPDKLIPFAIIALIIVLIIFGPKQLPELGKSLAKTMRSIREGVEGKDDELPEAAKAEADKADADKADAAKAEADKEPAPKA
jgi:sec-independent protein translocase protein TatA